MYKFIKNIFVNPRKRVNKLYVVLEKANKELDEIRKDCPHKTWHTGNYGWAPGHFNFGGICDNCDKYLGEAKTLKDWWGEFMSQWQNYAQYIIKKPEFLSQKVTLNFSDPFRQRFYLKKELDKELRELVENRTANGEHMSKEMKEYFDKWVNKTW